MDAAVASSHSLLSTAGAPILLQRPEASKASPETEFLVGSFFSSTKKGKSHALILPKSLSPRPTFIYLVTLSSTLSSLLG